MTLQELAERAAARHDRQAVGLHVQAALPWGLALGVLALLAGHTLLGRWAGSWFLVAQTLTWTLAAAALASALAVGLRRGRLARRGPSAVLTRLDRALGLKSQLAGGLTARGPFAPLAQARADAQAARVDLPRDLPRPATEPTLLPLVAGFLALAWALPEAPPVQPPAVPALAPAAHARATADRVEAVADALRRAARDLPAADRAASQRQAATLERRAQTVRSGAATGTASQSILRAHLAQAAGELASLRERDAPAGRPAPQLSSAAASPDASEGATPSPAEARYERALDQARAELQRLAALPPGGAGGGAAVTRPAAPGEPGAPTEDARAGEPGDAQPTPGRPAGGGRRPGSPEGGAPARGASGSVPVAGRGQAPGGERQRGASGEGQDAHLRSVLGEQGRATLVAVDELRRGELSPDSQRVLERMLRSEEAALRHDPVPPERRRLVRGYLETIRGKP